MAIDQADKAAPREGRVLISIDNHVPVSVPFYRPDPAVAREAMERLIEVVRPRRITVFAVGHDGRAQFPSAVFPTVPGLDYDLVALWREVIADRPIEFFIYVSTLRNDIVRQLHPEFARRFSNGHASNVLDHNSAFVETLLLPLLQEVIDRYDPDGFFFDGDFWTVHESWHPAVTALFKRHTGLAPPKNFGHPNFLAFRKFTYTTYEWYVRKLERFFQAQRRPVNWTINNAYSFRDPSPRPASMARTTVDMPPFFGLVESYIEAHFAQLRSSEFDINFPRFMHPEGSNRSQTKSTIQIQQELSVAHCASSATHFYLPMREDGRIPAEELVSLTGELNQFAQRYGRQPRALGYELVRGLAILHSEEHARHYRDLAPIRGASIALFGAGLIHSILTDQQLREAPAIEGILIADTLIHKPETLDQVEQRWRGGLPLVVSGQSLHSDPNLRALVERAVAAPDTSVAPRGGAAAPAGERPWAGAGIGDGAVVVCRFGGGRGPLFLIGGHPFRDFNRHLSLRALTPLFDALRGALTLPIEIGRKSANIFAKVYTHRARGSFLICLSNLAFGGPSLARHCYYARVPWAEPVALRFAQSPARVTQNTGEQTVDLAVRDHRVETRPFEVYATVEVRF